MTATTFGELPLQARFKFRGVVYIKLALVIAEDSRRVGHVFLSGTLVEWEPGPEGENLELTASPH
jgi:hypothetical protein